MIKKDANFDGFSLTDIAGGADERIRLAREESEKKKKEQSDKANAVKIAERSALPIGKISKTGIEAIESKRRASEIYNQPLTKPKNSINPYRSTNFVGNVKNSDDYINQNSPFSEWRISSKTGARNTGIAGASKMHTGIDRAMPAGTAITLPIHTTFYASGYDDARGNWIEVKDKDGNILHYQHLSKVGSFKKGAPIMSGTTIALSGNSGVGSGAHLHEEYYSADGKNITESYWHGIDYKGTMSTPNILDTAERILKGTKEHTPGQETIDNNTAIELGASGGRTLTMKASTKKAIDRFVKVQGENQTITSKALSLDHYISRLGLSDEEREAAQYYANIKKLDYFGKDNGENSAEKELTQPIANFFKNVWDTGQSGVRNLKSAAEKLGGDDTTYNQRYAETAKYYEENPDKIFDDYKLYQEEIRTGMPNFSLGDEKREYLRELQLDKFMERYNNTNAITKFISEAGFGSAGRMAGSYGVAGMFGLPEITSRAGTTIGNISKGTKIGQKAANVLSKTPSIKTFAGTSVVSKTANKAIGAVNKLSAGKVLNFLNPFENPTTLVMGANAASDKYTEVIKMGYDEETAAKNALFSGYVSAITEKMGYNGKDFGVIDYVMSGKQNAKNILKQYLSQNVSEGVEEIYNMVFERLGDKLMGVGYKDETGELRERSLFGKDGIFDIGTAAESFLGGFVGGAVMGGVGVISQLANSSTRKIRAHAKTVRKATDNINNNITEAIKAAGIDDVTLPEAPSWQTATVGQMNDYLVNTIETYKKVLSDERVKAYDEKRTKRLSIENLSNNRKYVQATEQVIKSENPKDWENEIISYVNKTVRNGSDVTFTTEDGEDITITGRTAWKLGDKGSLDDNVYFVKGNASGVIDEIVQVSKGKQFKEAKKEHSRGFGEKGFRYKTAYFRDVDGGYYRLKLSVGINQDGMEMYNIGDIKKVPFPVTGSKAGRGTTPSMNSIYNNYENVNMNFSENQINFAKKLGLTIEADESLDANGKIILSDGRIVYSPYSSIGANELLNHEVTHWLKVTVPQEYQRYIDILKNEFPDEWKAKQGEVRRDYVNYAKAHSDVKVTRELIREETAARFSEKLYDEAFIKRVAESDYKVAGKIRNALKNFIDRIKRLFSKKDIAENASDIRRLLKAKQAWERAAVRAVSTKKNGRGDKHHNINRISNVGEITKTDVKSVQSIGRKSVNEFTGEDIQKTEAFARKYFEELGTKSPFFRAWFGDWRANDKQKVNVVTKKGQARGVHKNADTGWDIQVSGKVFNESRHEGQKNQTALPYLEYIDGIVENAVLLDSFTVSEGKAKSPNSAMMHSMYALADIGSGTELIKMYVEELRDVNTDGTIKRSYQLQNISATKTSSLKVQSSGVNLSSIIQTADGYSVADLFKIVKQFDKNFKPKEVHPELLNEDGTPKVVYHGTNFDSGNPDIRFAVKDENKKGYKTIETEKPIYKTDWMYKEKDFPQSEKEYKEYGKYLEDGRTLYEISLEDNKKLKRKQGKLIELLSKATEIHINALRIGEIAKKYKKTYESHISEKEFTERLTAIYRGMEKAGARIGTTEEKARAQRVASELLYNLAYDILNSADIVDRTKYNTYSELREVLKNKTLYISKQDAHDIPDFEMLRRGNNFRVRFTTQKGKGQDVDSFYEELIEEYPELFGQEDITAPSDRLLHIIEVRNSLDPTYRNRSNIADEASALGVELYMEFFENENIGEEARSIVDIFKNEYLPELREKHEFEMLHQQRAYEKLLKEALNRNENVRKRIRATPLAMGFGETHTDTPTDKYDGVVDNVKNAGVTFVKRESFSGRFEAIVPTFERADINAVRENSEYKKIIERCARRQKIDEDYAEGESYHRVGSYTYHSIWRNMERFFGKDFPKMKELILDKLDDSKKQLFYLQRFYTNKLHKEIVKDLGIKKGSKLSKLVQKYGEKQLTTEEINAISEEDLQKIAKADKIFREMYQGIIRMVNDTRRKIYPNAEKRARKLEEQIAKIEKQIGLIELGFITGDFADVTGFDNNKLERIEIKRLSAEGRRLRIKANADARIRGFEEEIRRLENLMADVKNKETVKYQQYAERLVNLQTKLELTRDLAEQSDRELMAEIDGYSEEFTLNTEENKRKIREKLTELYDSKKKKTEELLSDEIQNGRIILERKNYYRHFAEIAEKAEYFKSYIEHFTTGGMSPAKAARMAINHLMNGYNIDPMLEGKSHKTKPKTKWQSFAQRRAKKTKAVTYDAVGGFLEYLPAALYSACIDPNISVFRGLAEDLAKESKKMKLESGKNDDGVEMDYNASAFVGYLEEYANDLAGKTNRSWLVTDEALQKALGRDGLRLVSSIAGWCKGTMVLGNVGSMFAQILNLSGGVAQISSPIIWVNAIGDTAKWYWFGDKERQKDSSFMAERYANDFLRFDNKIIAAPKYVTNFMMQFFDELTARIMWNAAYRQAQQNGYPLPTRYADDFLRRIVGGRGIGELQLVQKNTAFKTIFPFTVEVMNTFDLMKDIATKKDRAFMQRMWELFMFFLGNAFLNALMEWIRGSDGGLIDPIGVVYRGIKDEKSPLQITGEVAGNAIASTWWGEAAAKLYPEQGFERNGYTFGKRADVFGDENPARFATWSGSVDIGRTIIKYVLPFGGQIDKTVRGIQALKKGGVYKKDGSLKYRVGDDPIDAVRAVVFGPNAIKGAKWYFEGNSNLYQKYLKSKIGYKNEYQKEFERLSELDSSVVPGSLSKRFTCNNVEYNLTGADYDNYVELCGTRAVQYRDAVIDTAEYKAANDVVKAAMMKKAMSQAEKDGKMAYAEYKRTGEKNLKGEYKNPFEGMTVIGNDDDAAVYEAEGFSKGKGYAEVEIDNKKYVLQGDKYNQYEKARYEAYAESFDNVVDNKTVTLRAKTKAEAKENKTKVKRMLLSLLEDGKIDKNTAVEKLAAYCKGIAIELPATAALGVSEKRMYYIKDLRKEERKSKITSLKSKYKKGKITKEEVLAILKSEEKIEVDRYITTNYRSLTSEQRDKVDAALNKKAKDMAIGAVDVG